MEEKQRTWFSEDALVAAVRGALHVHLAEQPYQAITIRRTQLEAFVQLVLTEARVHQAIPTNPHPIAPRTHTSTRRAIMVPALPLTTAVLLDYDVVRHGSYWEVTSGWQPRDGATDPRPRVHTATFYDTHKLRVYLIDLAAHLDWHITHPPARSES